MPHTISSARFDRTLYRCAAILTTGVVGLAMLAGCDSAGEAQSSQPSTEQAATGESRAATTNPEAPAAPTLPAATVARIDGSEVSLDEYRGKVVLVVNVASKCGLTPQYESLQRLYESMQGEGFVVLGFPANNFGGQEPGSNAEIAEFCSDNYNVTFPMFAKISVTGDDQHEVYRELSKVGGPPSWNFTKYLVDQSGHVVRRFDPRTSPESPELTEAIDQLLAAG